MGACSRILDDTDSGAQIISQELVTKNTMRVKSLPRAVW